MVLFLHEKKNMCPGAGFAVLTRLRCFLFAGFQNMLEIRITSSCMDAQLSEFSCRYILEAISQQRYVSQIFEFSELGYFLELREKVARPAQRAHKQKKRSLQRFVTSKT